MRTTDAGTPSFRTGAAARRSAAALLVTLAALHLNAAPLPADRPEGWPEPDYLQLVRRYADCMIRHGRDRYGKVHSPLFASTLTRGSPPTLLPPPEFAPGSRKYDLPKDLTTWPGQPSPWVFQRFTNIPTLHHLGSEDAHKETVVGEDVLEHLHLYRTLWKLSEVTGDARYKAEADKALAWWFEHTQSRATGLYPWGEHLGWDFRADDVSYNRPPYHTLFSRIYHEPRAVDFRDVLDVMARLPARGGAEHTPLERFAIGLRDWHVWNLDKGHFSRHGDYFGHIKPSGHSEFPRIAGWFFDVWSKACVASRKPAFRRRMVEDMSTLADALDRRVKQVGYFPFTARHESENRKPEGYSARQVMNAAAKIHLAGDRLKRAEPALAARLRRFAEREFRYFMAQQKGAAIPPAVGLTLKASYDMCRRKELLALFRRAADEAVETDASSRPGARGPMPWARGIQLLVGAYEQFGEAKYLQAARSSARAAVALLFDDTSPLPKVSADPVHLPDGRPFPVYYHGAIGCDDLMYALTCLAGAKPSSAPGGAAAAAPPGPIRRQAPAPLPAHAPWDVRKLQAAPAFEWRARSGKVHSLLYRGQPYKGAATRVFALYASPVTLGAARRAGERFPAVVLVHGGGGHAYPQWAELYAKRGYAAIAMDLAGKVGIGRQAKRLPDGGPPQDDHTKFRLSDVPDRDQWTYHAVANVVLAHSLIRGFDEVDPDRTGVIGISWGGYLTCIAAAVDGRFKAALPMYGCGFLQENSAWARSHFRHMSPEWKRKWVRFWDPSSYVASATMPMFFVNGANDPFYPLDDHARTYALVRAPKNIRLEVGMAHGHRFDVKECLWFFDEHLRGGTPLPRVVEVHTEGEQLTARVESKTRIASGALYWTTGSHKDNRKRPWQSAPLRVDGKRLRGPKPPAEATAWFVSVTDERRATVSSPATLAGG